MVTGTHPEDVELFDYVEGDLPGDRRAELEAHLGACTECAEHVARVHAARDALRAARALELPPQRRDAILLDLRAQGRAASRTPWLSPRRLLTVLALLAVLAAAVVALVTTGGGPSGQGAGGGATPQAAATTGGGGKEFAPAQDGRGLPAPLTFPGPADAVADELRGKGFDARVVGKHVEVRNARRAEVKRALQHQGAQATAAQRVKIVIVP